MFPALTTVPSGVVHAIKLVMHHPKVMKNVQEEIDRVIGTERLVTWEDRKRYNIYENISLILTI